MRITGCHHTASNAVAPDWNLKAFNAEQRSHFIKNAVAPDWNLKILKWCMVNTAVEMQSHQIGI